MKSKLSKILTIFMLFIIIASSITCTAHAESNIELIPSSDGDTLVVHSEIPGGLYDILINKHKYYYDHIKITGKMNDKDFLFLTLASFNCKSIDLYEVDAKSMPSDLFCE